MNMLCYEDPTIGVVKFSTLACDFSNLVGIAEESHEIISISPNPTKGKIRIEFPNDTWIVEVRDATGRTILNSTPSSKEYMLDLSTVDAGLYFLVLKDGNQKTNIYKVIRD